MIGFVPLNGSCYRNVTLAQVLVLRSASSRRTVAMERKGRWLSLCGATSKDSRMAGHQSFVVTGS